MIRGRPLVPELISSPEREHWLKRHVPYRIRALNGLQIYKDSPESSKAYHSLLPALFEGCLICCRWSASFLGLIVEKRLLKKADTRPRPSDVFCIDLGGTLIDPATLLPAEQDLLLKVFVTAHVGTAHPVRERPALGTAQETIDYVSTAASILIREIKIHLYDVLREPAPK